MAAMDWNVDLTASLEDKCGMELCAASPPDSSSASELGEYEFNCSYAEIYQQTESFAPPGSEDLGLLDSLLALDNVPAESHGPSTPPDAWASAADFHATPPPAAVDASDKAPAAESAHTKPPVSTAAAGALPAGPEAAAGDAGRKRKEMETPPPALAPVTYHLQPPTPVAVVTGVPRVTGTLTDPRRSESPDEEDPFGLNGRELSSLTPEEQKLWKKQKRLIKNRESAQLSRQRKKNHMETLELQVQRLEQERLSVASRMEQLEQENALLKKQLAAQGCVPQTSAPASAPSATPSAPSAPSASPGVGAAAGGAARPPPKAALALAVVFACGMFCTQLDLSPPRLPSLRGITGGAPRVAGASSLPGIDGPKWDAPVAGRAGRVLLSSGGADDFAEGSNAGGKGGKGSGGMQGQRQLLIVTLLDHLVGQLPSSPTLLPRLCRRLAEMGVLDTCDFLERGEGGMEELRRRFVIEFRAFSEEFARKEPGAGVKVTYEHATTALTNAIGPRPPTPPPPLPFWAGVLDHPGGGGGGVKVPRRAAVNIFAPQAQLLIADRPANDDSTLGARLSRKQRAAGEEDDDRQDLADSTALSMVVPRKLLDSVGHRLPKEETPLVEVRCAAYDLLPAFESHSGMTFGTSLA